MEKLYNFLINHKDSDLNNLPDLKINQLNNLESYNDLESIISSYDLGIDFSAANYNLNLLRLCTSSLTVNIFRFLSSYLLFISIGILILYPIFVSNYWLYFTLPLAYISFIASGVYPTFYSTLFNIMIIIFLILIIFLSKYVLIGILVGLFLMKVGPYRSKMYYRNSLVKYAMNNELVFKFLYLENILQLRDKKTEEIVTFRRKF